MNLDVYLLYVGSRKHPYKRATMPPVREKAKKSINMIIVMNIPKCKKKTSNQFVGCYL